MTGKHISVGLALMVLTAIITAVAVYYSGRKDKAASKPNGDST